MEGKGELGIEPDRLVVVGDGAVIVRLGGIGEAAVVEGRGRLWIEPDRLVVVGDGAVVVLLGGIGEAAIVEGMDIFRIEPDRLVVVGDGAVVVLLGGIGEAAVVEGLRGVNQSACAKGRRSNCLIALGLRLLEVKRFCCGLQPGTISTGMKPAATEPASRSAITSATASSPTMMKVTAASVTLG